MTSEIPTTPKPFYDKNIAKDNGVESTTNDVKEAPKIGSDEQNSGVESSIVKNEPDEQKSDVGISVDKNEPAPIIQDDEIGSTESDTVAKSEIKDEVAEPDSTEKSVKTGTEKLDDNNGNPDVKLESSDLNIGHSHGKVDSSDKHSEVSTSEGMDLSVKKSDSSPNNVKKHADVKVTNGTSASSSVPNILAILGQRPANGAQEVPGIIPIMGPHGLTLGQLGASLTGINVAQLAALAGMNPLNFAQLAGAGMAQMASAQMLQGSANNARQKRPNMDSNSLPKKKQRLVSEINFIALLHFIS